MTFVVGAVLLIIGMMFFTLGAEMAMTPMGERIGTKLTNTRKISVVIVLCFILGFIITISEPDLAIVFEGSPSDDFFISAGQAQGCMKKGVQIRILDNSYISNTQFISLAEEVAEKCGIKYQESVRRGGSTNAAKISVTGKAVPCLVLGVPSRYAHSHYNFCAKEDLEAASAMAANVIRALDE
jgi:putative aminopeptidase FrvX